MLILSKCLVVVVVNGFVQVNTKYIQYFCKFILIYSLM